MAAFLRFLTALPLLLLSPILILLPALGLALSDLAWKLFRRRRLPPDTRPDTSAATIVIPNWNGRDLLEKYLPSVLAATAHSSKNEVIVVDDGSADGSADFVESHFPTVRVLRQSPNRGFGAASTAGFKAARNDIVVLLNSDMRVAPDFLQPLLDAFSDKHVFAASCQIFFSDPNKVREETGLTQAWWDSGRLRVRHRADDQVTAPYPCFYGGGGSCAFDRRKFLELGAFDELLRPFYLEDTDLGMLAWKRGWKVLYQPASHVWHEHRGTIGKKFSAAYIDSILKKNFLLFIWKNIHEPRRLAEHFAYTWADAILSAFIGHSPERATLAGLLRACLQLPAAIHSRWRARSLAAVSDTEAFLRPLGGYYRDRFSALEPEPARLSVLFVSPYPIIPTHGGGVFMLQTTLELARHTDLHLIVLLDHAWEEQLHADLVARCRSAVFIHRMTGQVRTFGSPQPHAVMEFANHDLEWLIHRQILLHRVDVLQLEYLPLAQYAAGFRQIPSILFEHDIYFQSIGRQLPNMVGLLQRLQASFEYLRAIRYELGVLPRLDRIQVCSRDNAQYLLEFLPSLDGRIDDELRAGIDTSRYDFQPTGRQPETMLFLGSFRHLPNMEALDWFIRHSLPEILRARPGARLIVVGSDPPPRHSLPLDSPAIEMRGFVDDVRVPLGECAVFICPILSGSGMRVKLLEAFAAGIPTVSTRMGAEGLAWDDGLHCHLADDPREFAAKVLRLFDEPEEAAAMATRAREYVADRRDMKTITRRLAENYAGAVRAKRQDTALPDQL